MLFITNENELQLSLPQQALYFYLPWEPFHHKYLVMISQFEHLPFFAIDLDAFPKQVKRFSIRSIPSILLLKGGKETARLEGKITASAFQSIFV
jgi:thioredoxin-like negative regulator of GroEL